jgi:NTE family protein
VSDHPESAARSALVLAGGGARGAYQAGVLAGLAELGLLEPAVSGLDTFVGSSAGAINSVMLAAHADEPVVAVDRLIELWSSVRAQDVFRTDARTLGETGIKWAWDLTFGGAVGGGSPKSLLDTAPLREFLRKQVPFARLGPQVASGALHALAISTTDMATGDGVLFLEGQPGIATWQRRRWHVRKDSIGVDHILASSAIPIFFPTVEIDGRHYGDGSVRNTAPLSPAINLGARRILAVSVREPTRPGALAGASQAPSIAQIAGVLLDAVLLDAVEVDVDHSQRVNRSIVTVHDEDRRRPFRHVDVLWIQPSVDLSALAASYAHQIPGVVRYLMRGLGNEESTTELASYLLFDAEFCRKLIEVGRADAHAAREQVEAFFGAGSGARSVPA